MITTSLQVDALHKNFDALQLEYGGRGLRAIYGAGSVDRPKIAFVFMNPTARNISAQLSWNGFRAAWLGTKNIWKLCQETGAISAETLAKIQNSTTNWTNEFCESVYQEVASNGCYITNLAKCTQHDARALPDAFFKAYRELLLKEISIINPRAIVSFGNQVSSILLQMPIKISEAVGRSFTLQIKNQSYPVWPTYYPVGQGMRNMPKAVANVRYVLSTLR